MLGLPRVTVCVPVRNGSRTIRRTLDSILAQDYPNLEVIVSDNCSTDDTAQIVQEYAGCGVKYYLNPKLEASGESNWNHVLSLAQGSLIALYHADDIYTPTMVRRQVEFLEAHPETSAVFTMTQRIDEQDRPIRMGSTRLPQELQGQERFDFPTLLNAVLKYGNFMMVPTMMTRRETLDAVGVFRWEKFASASDIDLYLRMAQWGPIGIIDEPLHRYRVSSQQGSAQINKARVFRAHFFVVMDYYLSVPEIRQYAKPEALFRYEMYSISDDIVRVMNMALQGNIREAKVLLESDCARAAFRAGLRVPAFTRQFSLSIVLLIAFRLGLGRFVSSMYNLVYQPWRRKRQLQPLPRS